MFNASNGNFNQKRIVDQKVTCNRINFPSFVTVRTLCVSVSCNVCLSVSLYCEHKSKFVASTLATYRTPTHLEGVFASSF